MLYLDTLTLQMWLQVIKFKQDLPYLNQDLKCLNIDLPCLKRDLRYLKRQELLQAFTAFPHRLCLKVSKFQNEFMKLSFLPKSDQKIVKISALTKGQ